MSESEGLDDEELFDTGDIFANRELVTVGHVPDEDRIVGRDEEMRQVGRALGPAIEGSPPRNLIIYGKTGTGKSLVAKHVTTRAEYQAHENGVNFITCYVDCSNENTETRVAREMTFSVQDRLAPDKHIPPTGIGASEYYRYLWSILSDQDVFVVVLDEIDKLQDDEVLMQLSRAKETGKTTCNIGVISISNKIEYRDRLNKRIDSSLQDREHVFDPYDGPQLEEILENRRDAFKEEVLNEGVISLASSLAAREHGDARKAIDILLNAGDLAEEGGDDAIREQHVRDAKELSEINRFKELIGGSPAHVKCTLEALALLTKERKKDEFPTSEVYSYYKLITDREGMDPLKKDSIYRRLDEQAFLGVTESKHTGGGKGKGSYLVHSLVTEPDVVIEAVNDLDQ